MSFVYDLYDCISLRKYYAAALPSTSSLQLLHNFSSATSGVLFRNFFSATSSFVIPNHSFATTFFSIPFLSGAINMAGFIQKWVVLQTDVQDNLLEPRRIYS